MIRRQLSLFVEPTLAQAIERIRAQLDPVQSALIPAHVTLCRDAEVATLDANELGDRIAGFGPIELTFGEAEAFDGHGVRLPCIMGIKRFHELRCALLQSHEPREESPHITLAHPRNPVAPGNHLDAARALPPRLRIPFVSVRLIEQTPGEPWRTVSVTPL
jgi:2'-5' RNA ligase